MTVHELLLSLINAGWTQTQIAEESGVYQSAISRILAGKQKDLSFSDGKRLEEIFKSNKKAA